MSAELDERYAEIRRKIADAAKNTGREPTLIAVSKTQPPEAIAALYRLGHRDFGENYAQELVDKATRLAASEFPDIRWHFIGHLQTNKVKSVVPFLHSIHSVNSLKLAQELSRRTGERRLACFLEINIDREESKTGIFPEEAASLARKIVATCGSQLHLQGLMAIPANTEDPAHAARSFRALRDLEVQCQPYTSGFLSMGMSGDYELAIAQGATHVRVGTALFGERRPRVLS